jgi:hypothetical protein
MQADADPNRLGTFMLPQPIPGLQGFSHVTAAANDQAPWPERPRAPQLTCRSCLYK